MSKIIEKARMVKVDESYFGENPRAASQFEGMADDLKIDELAFQVIEDKGLTDPPQVWKATDDLKSGLHDVGFHHVTTPVWMIVKGHRRFMAIRRIREMDEESVKAHDQALALRKAGEDVIIPAVTTHFKDIFPRGEVQCLIFESEDYNTVMERKQDHAHVVGLTSHIDVLVNVEAHLARKLGRETSIRALYPVFDAAHGRTFQGKRKHTIAALEAQIEDKNTPDPERTRLKSMLLNEEIVPARTGLFQHYENIAKGPEFVRRWWIHFTSGGRVPVPEECVYALSPTKSLTNKEIKELRTANKVNGQDGHRIKPTEACLKLWGSICRTQAAVDNAPKDKPPQFRGNGAMTEMKNKANSQGLADILESVVRESGNTDGTLPDLSVVDTILRYHELILEAGFDCMITTEEGKAVCLADHVDEVGRELHSQKTRFDGDQAMMEGDDEG